MTYCVNIFTPSQLFAFKLTLYMDFTVYRMVFYFMLKVVV